MRLSLSSLRHSIPLSVKSLQPRNEESFTMYAQRITCWFHPCQSSRQSSFEESSFQAQANVEDDTVPGLATLGRNERNDGDDGHYHRCDPKFGKLALCQWCWPNFISPIIHSALKPLALSAGSAPRLTIVGQIQEGLAAYTGMQGFGARQASIDYHLEIARRCLASSASQRSLLSDGPLPRCEEEVVVGQARHGSRIAAKIVHLRNVTAALTPLPATTEADLYSVLDRFRASVETLWSDRREHSAGDRMDSRPPLVQAHVDSPVSRRSLELLSTSIPRHRRAGSSRI